jgi:hypothetical protein
VCDRGCTELEAERERERDGKGSERCREEDILKMCVSLSRSLSLARARARSVFRCVRACARVVLCMHTQRSACVCLQKEKHTTK